MAAGIILARWFGGEAERVYAMMGGDPDDAGGVELAELQMHIEGRGGRITACELRDTKRRYRGGGTARDALNRMVEAGFGRWEQSPPGKKGGRPVEVFVLNAPVAKPHGRPVGGLETTVFDSHNEGFATATARPEGFCDQLLPTDNTVDDRDHSNGDPDGEDVEVTL
ncbi:MAG: hypothetical protein FWD61_13140 [Phycisphaerales bacterium]|nr:hypothetical protein [Phycisphaerales bacterium]